MTKDEIDSLLLKRKSARDRKDWIESDAIRDELKASGILVVDTANGQVATGGSSFEKDWKPCFASLQSRIETLEFSLKIMEKRERLYNKKIGDLVEENLTLKYGKTCI